MKTLNTLKIGKYTFAVSFLIGNVYLIGFIISSAFEAYGTANLFAFGGLIYIVIAAIINILILIALVIYGLCVEEKYKDSFVGASFILINIPLAILYFFVGLYLYGIAPIEWISANY